MFKSSRLVSQYANLAKCIPENEVLEIERVYLQEKNAVPFASGKWIPIGVESYGRWRNNLTARKKEARIRFTLQPATWNLPKEYIKDGQYDFLVDDVTKADILTLEKAVSDQWNMGGEMRSIVREKTLDKVSGKVNYEKQTLQVVRTKFNKTTHVFKIDNKNVLVPSTMEEMKDCSKRTVQIYLVITGAFQSTEGWYQLSSCVEQIQWKAKEDAEKRSVEEIVSQIPQAKKARKSTKPKITVENQPCSQKHNVLEKTKTWTQADLMKWVDEYLNRYERVIAITPQSMDTDDVENMLEAYNRTKVVESIESLTKTFLDDVHHLPSFIRSTETRVTQQSRCHHSTYSAQPRDPFDWCIMRTENTEINVSESFVDILKAGFHEARMTYIVGPEQKTTEKHYFDIYYEWSSGYEADDEMEVSDDEGDESGRTEKTPGVQIQQYLADFVRNRCINILALNSPEVELKNSTWHTLLTPFLEMVHQTYWLELRYQLLLKMELENHLLECVQVNAPIHMSKSKRFLRDAIIWAIKHLIQTYNATHKTGLADPRNRADYYLIMKTVEKRAREIFTPEEWTNIKGKKGAVKNLQELLRVNRAAKCEYEAAFADFDNWTYETARFHETKCHVCGRQTCVNCPSEACTQDL